MNTRTWRTTYALMVMALLAVSAAAAAGAAKPPAGTVAVVAGQAVSEEELNAAVGNRLMRVKTEEYNLRRAALDEIISDRVLKAEAAKRHVTVEELLKTEVESKVSIPSTADLETFYEGVKERFPGANKDEAIKQIGDGMRKQQVSKKKAEFVQKLRAAAGVNVLLDAPRAQVKAEGPTRGKATAPVTIVEFSDFECTFCSRAVDTLRSVRENYGDKVRLVYRDYPLPSHRGAPRASEAAHCADDQGKFWEMHDRLFAKSGSTQGDAALRTAASDAGLDLDAFTACLASGKYAQTWKASQDEGMRAGVGSTPTFFVNGRMIIGAVPYETFSKVIDEELERTSAAGVTGTK